MFWIRDALSCASVMDRCALGQDDFDRMRPKIEAALSQYGGAYNQTLLHVNFGLEGASPHEPDCTVQLQDSWKILPVIRVHDLYKDPSLTDCARYSAKLAGGSFLTWLRSKGIKLDFIGSSNLARAVETAVPFFFEQDHDLLRSVVRGKREVTPVPYLAERAPNVPAALQVDNQPRPFQEQKKLLTKAKYLNLAVGERFAETWPRDGQQFEKFKALLATQIVPLLGNLRDTMPWAAAPEEQFREALEATQPASLKRENHGKVGVQFDWAGGSYETGNSFLRHEYNRLEAEEVTIAFVGHGQMMADYCEDGDAHEKPASNAVYEKLFVMEVTPGVQRGDVQFARTVMRELAGTCGKVMDGPSSSEVVSSLVRRDVAVCQDPFVVSEWIGLKSTPLSEKIFGNSKPTPCMAMADKPDAYSVLPSYRDEGLSITI